MRELRAVARLRVDSRIDLDVEAVAANWTSVGWTLIRAIGAAQATFAALFVLSMLRGDSALAVLQGTICASFLAASLLLIGRGRRRNGSLGLGEFFLLAAAAFSRPVLSGPEVPLGAFLSKGPYPEAFMAFAMWRFASDFGRDYRFTPFDRWSAVLRRLAGWVGLALFIDSAVMAWLVAPPAGVLGEFLWRFRRDDGGSALWFWDPLLLLIALAVIAAIYRSLRAGDDDRRRALWLITALGVGLLPIVGVALLRTAMPAVNASIEQTAGLRGTLDAVVLIGLLSLPFTTAYAVLVRRTLPLKAVVRGFARYVLARQVLLAIALVPLATLLLRLYANRHRSVAELMTIEAVGWEVAASAIGWIVLASRDRVRRAVSRMFGAGTLDQTVSLAHATAAIGRGRTTTEVAFEIVRQACQLTAAESGEILLRTARGPFRSANGSAASLPLDSAWLAILDDTPCLDVPARPEVLALVPQYDREWLAAAGFELLAKLSSPGGEVVGVLGLRPRSGGWPYSKADLTSLSAFVASAGMALDQRDDARQGGRVQSDELECTACGRAQAPRLWNCAIGREWRDHR